MPQDDRPLVYSTEGKPVPAPKATPQTDDTPVKGQTARVMRSSKGRGGKTVTLVSGLKHCPQAFDDLAKRLKQVCGSGGAVKDGEIVIQGDHRDKVAQELRAQGYTVKLAGG